VILQGLSPGSHAHLHLLNEAGERATSSFGFKYDVQGKVCCAGSEDSISHLLKSLALAYHVSWGLQWCETALTPVRVRCVGTMSGIVFPSESMFCEEPDGHAEIGPGCCSNALHEFGWHSGQGVV
jgi:hypothetical protein